MYDPKASATVTLTKEQWRTILHELKSGEERAKCYAENLEANPSKCNDFREAAEKYRAYADELIAMKEEMELQLGYGPVILT